MGKTYIVPFKMNEEEIRKNFLDWVILGDSTPIDIAYTAEITGVQQAFYPVRGVLAKYQADWSATSYWEHTERYDVQTPMVKYRDSAGNIHTVTEKAYGNMLNNHLFIVERFYKTETKQRTVTDNVERTSGSIFGEYYGKVITLEKQDDDYIQWLDSIPLDEKTAYDESQISGILVKPLVNTDEYAENQTAPSIRSKATEECQNNIPGNRYEEFQLDDLSAKFDIDLYHVPIYEVAYQYNGNQYTATMSGSVRDSVYAVSKPVDANLEEKKKTLETELETLKKRRLIYGLIGFLLPIVLLFGGIFILGMMNAPNEDLAFPLTGAVFVFVFFIGFLFIPTHKKVKAQDAFIESHLNNLNAKRQEILAIVSNDSLTAEEQKAQIKHLIEG